MKSHIVTVERLRWESANVVVELEDNATENDIEEAGIAKAETLGDARWIRGEAESLIDVSETKEIT